ncbi:MAG: membrane protein insertion efficiency factor YidD [Deltaproteobacteria bacterium]|nr:MAG: membrane protein insertion efficiency factor YidD [Deltaproteobacteria bacterium]
MRPPSSRAPWSSRPRAESRRPDVVAVALIALLRAYRLVVAPGLPPSCRFVPSCSAFGVEALERHGAARGLRLTIGRLARCHPWTPGGYDPVPGPEV